MQIKIAIEGNNYNKNKTSNQPCKTEISDKPHTKVTDMKMIATDVDVA